MKRNIELLQKTLQHIKDHPESHEQQCWVNICGTAFCFAGWAARLSGWSVQRIDIEMCPAAGSRLLGIDVYQGAVLFNVNNTIPMLEMMVKDLVNGDRLQLLGYYAEEADHNDEDRNLVL